MIYSPHMNTILFLLFMVPGTFFLGCYDILTKKLLTKNVSPSLLLGVVYTCSGLINMSIALLTGIPTLQPQFYAAFAGTVSLNIFSQLIWFKAFELEEASLVSPLRMLTPPFVLLTGLFFLHEKPSVGGISGIFVTMIGFFILVSGKKSKQNIAFKSIWSRKGIWLAVIGALMFAVSFPLDKQALMASSTFFFAGATALCIGLPYLLWNVIFRRSDFAALANNKKLLPFILAHTLGSLLTFQALNYTLAAYAAGAKRLWSVWTVLLSGSFLKEKNIGRKLFATGIMLVGIIVSLVME